MPKAAIRTGVALLVVCAAATSCTGGSTPTPAKPSTPPGGAVIAAFARAWSAGHLDAMRGVVDAPTAAAQQIAADDGDVKATSTTITLSGDLRCRGSSCSEHATVRHELAGFGPWTYRTSITSVVMRGHWLVLWTPSVYHPGLTASRVLASVRTLPPRAPILDRNGVPLTPERSIERVGVVPKKVRPATYPQLHALLDIEEAPLKTQVAAAQPDWFVPVIDLRRAAYLPLRARLLKVPGISLYSSRRALAPTATWARPVLGTVGPATVDALKNAGPGALDTDEVGLSGLQYVFQRQLAGTPGLRVDLVRRSDDTVLKHLFVQRPRPGRPLRTTLDLAAQTAAENAVAAATTVTAAVVVKATTGEVLAAANAPGPTSYNTAFVGQYAPGSTFKIVTAATLLHKGVLGPESPLPCPDTIVVDGKRFKNYETGIVGANPTFADAFAASCNTAFVSQRAKITGADLASMAQTFGFGQPWRMGLDGYSGSVPADTDPVTHAADMIGQGKVLSSPLQMALAAATVDSGVAHTPTLVPQLARGKAVGSLAPALKAQLRSLMRLVVTQGTGTVVNLPGLPVYAKTGTAEYQLGKGTGTNAWMVGFRGDIAFAVLVEMGTTGAGAAGPIVSSLLTHLPASLYR
ncbi:MAG: penicillin-binding transpeptidase domain-containing protein [Nocardioidaceae bacterium]